MPKLSNGGKESFLAWKTSFPPLEISFFKAGKFLETCQADSFYHFFHLADLTKLAKLPRKSEFVREETKNLHGGGI